ncbi:hypothetical protein BRADI_1g59340v3 [Brachypodium distachyon]|uniref:Strictosidine synthase conserved region domain-containing protein n=1 Tax=Brachypodium distachyon TaxID=15368 RepID=A0A0Q3K9U8_BRADI|nr:hypothetical protein BRADI_1g59340v3 [Brachypodium distachyon]
MASGGAPAKAAAISLLAAALLMLLVFLPGGVAAAGIVVPSIDALPRGLLRGPESVASDGKGRGPHSGVSDGRVLRRNGDKLGWTTHAYGPGYSADACTASAHRPETVTKSRCGRPLGLRFHLKSGNLYIADAYKGLMRVAPGGGEAKLLVNEVDGAPLRFTNGVDVDQVTGKVYFTDSSMNCQRSEHEMVTRTGDSTGRLMRYDLRTGKVVLLRSGSTYPNGLAISVERTHLVISSTGPCKLLRYWIKGSKAGTIEVLADLPGYPDNVRPDGRGGYWVALHGEKNELPFGFNSHLLALRIGGDGKILEEMRGPKSVRPTEVMERKGGRLFLGSVELPCVAVVTRK